MGNNFMGGDRTLSRQRRWQMRKKAEGKCITCGKPVKPGCYQCEKHYFAGVERHRQRDGWNPQEQSGMGRKPKYYLKKRKEIYADQHKRSGVLSD